MAVFQGASGKAVAPLVPAFSAILRLSLAQVSPLLQMH